MTRSPVRVGADWLALRAPADAAARSADLVALLASALPPTGAPRVVHDLGSGSGSMTRWLAPRLRGPQHWVLHDRDEALLRVARENLPAAEDGASVTVETRTDDVTRLGEVGGLEGAGLVTASALLDMLTAAELGRLVESCAAARCPVLFVLTVVGRVELDPAEPLDARVGAAFDAHQRRDSGSGRLLGPDASAAAVAALSGAGLAVHRRPSPWRLGRDQAALADVWFTGWLGAACEQEPGLTTAAGSWAERRRRQLAAGELVVTVHHEDLLALPPGSVTAA